MSSFRRILRNLGLGVWLCLPLEVLAAPAPLSLAQAVSSEQLMKLPVCSKSVLSNCRKQNQNGIWIAVGVLVVAGAIVAASSGGSGSNPPVSP